MQLQTNISIRAPARGATFISCPRAKILSFQSALPRGERPVALPAFAKGRNFNPRSREGSDGGSDQVTVYGVISIRAPARGATFAYDDFSFVGYISIRAPARGATGRDALITGVRTISIRAPARGATFLYDSDDVQLSFQSALPRGERRKVVEAVKTPVHISIRAPARGATAAPVVPTAPTRFQSALPRGERH